MLSTKVMLAIAQKNRKIIQTRQQIKISCIRLQLTYYDNSLPGKILKKVMTKQYEHSSNELLKEERRKRRRRTGLRKDHQYKNKHGSEIINIERENYRSNISTYLHTGCSRKDREQTVTVE